MPPSASLQPKGLTPGIHGWLVLFALRLFTAPVALYSHVETFEKMFLPLQNWTDPASPAYDGQWAALKWGETTGFACLGFAMVLGLWPLFFWRHRLLPAAYALFSMASGLLSVACAVLAGFMPAMPVAVLQSLRMQAAYGMIPALVWTAYALRSQRMRITFRRQLERSPEFPYFYAFDPDEVPAYDEEDDDDDEEVDLDSDAPEPENAGAPKVE